MSMSNLALPGGYTQPIGFSPFSPVPSGPQFSALFAAIGALPLLVKHVTLTNNDMINTAGATLVTIAVGVVNVTIVPLLFYGHSNLTAGAYGFGSNIRLRYHGTAVDIMNDGAALVDASATHHYKYMPGNLGFTNAANVATGKDLELSLATGGNTGGNVANVADVFVFYVQVPN